jgi:Flp pilus assembly protein TadG
MGAGTVKLIRRILRNERGDVDDMPALAILLIGIVVPLIGIVVFMGRYGMADNSIQSAASAAARDASLSRTEADAVPHATSAADTALAGNVNCSTLDVSIEGNGLHTALGQTGTVSATVRCTINTSDLSFPLIPGSMTITKTAVSPVDPYRQR